MNKLPEHINIEEREELLDTMANKNDTLRIVYRINTGKRNLPEEVLDYICNLLIENEDDANVDYKAITFFFWKDGMAVGEEPALASLTYAPGGLWERSMEQVSENMPEMKLAVDFNNYGPEHIND